MSIFPKIIKTLSILLGLIFISITFALYQLSKNPISISNNILQKILNYYDSNLQIDGKNANLSLVDNNLELNIDKAKITRVSSKDTIQINQINLTFSVWTLNGTFSTIVDNSEVIKFVNIPNEPTFSEFINNNYIIFNGNVTGSFNLQNFTNLTLNLSSNNGFHLPSSTKLDKISLEKLTLSANYQPNYLVINEFKFKYSNNIEASLSGEFNFKKSFANFNAEITNLPVNYLAGLWPKLLFPEVQDWIVKHISNGIIKNAKGKFNLTKEELKKEQINAEINIAGVQLNYLPNYSPITDIEGVVRFDGKSLYLDANSAIINQNNIKSAQLELSFEDFILQLKTHIIGKITKFKEFIPIDFSKNILKYGIDLNLIKGNIDGDVKLKFPISDEFDIKNFNLEINADIKDVIFDKLGFFRIKQGKLEILNNKDAISLKISGNKDSILEFIRYHDPSKFQDNKFKLFTEANIVEKINYKNQLELNSGTAKISLSSFQNLWQSSIDLSNANINFLALGYNKLDKINLLINCAGKQEDDYVSSENCKLSGQNFAGQINFNYNIANDNFSQLILNQMKFGENDFSFQSFFDKNFYTHKLSAKYLDLSKFQRKTFFNDAESNKNYRFTFKVDNLVLKNNSFISELSGVIGKVGNNPINITATCSSNKQNLSISKLKKNGVDGYLLETDAAATFSQALGIYNNIKKGNLSMEVFPRREKDSIIYSGKLILTKFNFTNTSTISKIILGLLSPLNSPQAMAQALQGGSLKADSLTADLEYSGSNLTVKNGTIIGPSYEIKVYGNADLKAENLNFKGVYIPSAYGINTFVSMIPLIGQLATAGGKTALIAANFSVNGSFDKPITSFNPLSAFAPGFLKEILR